MHSSPSTLVVEKSTNTPSRAILWGLCLLSASALSFEITLTRIFSVSQFYHFAFMIVSLALLGTGASGTALAIFPMLARKNLTKRLSLFTLLTGFAELGGYLFINSVPLDSYSIAWDRRQLAILILYYLLLTVPFFFAGLVIGLLLADFPRSVGKTYAVNLLGSAVGCVIALVAPSFFGGEGTVVLSSGLAALGSLIGVERFNLSRGLSLSKQMVPAIPAAFLLLFAFLDLALRLGGYTGFPGMELHLSPYKSLSYALQQPDSKVVFRRWNAFSRIDLVRSPSIHSIPGLSYRYLKPLPLTDGLFVDGDDLSPVLSQVEGAIFMDYLPTDIVYLLRPEADVLILEPRGGLDISVALSKGTGQITAVEVNPLIVESVGAPYQDSRVRVVFESERSFLSQTANQFGIIVYSLTSSYHPVQSGAYSLAEDYRYTVESFEETVRHLAQDGLLVVTRWLQNPPSEDLRTFALAVTALERIGASPQSQIVVFRGYSTATFLIKNGAFTPDELQIIRAFTAERAFDLIYTPDIRAEETNLYNILPESIYYQSYIALLDSSPRSNFYSAYPYDVTPPTDDHPFFSHYFKWSQTRQILAEMGYTWQPFGGAGYFVLLGLLVLTTLMTVVLILVPLAIRKPAGDRATNQPAKWRHLIYFILIGLAYLLVEIPLIQRFILYLDQPTYAMATVLFTLLLFSALGSAQANRVSHRFALLSLVILLMGIPLLLPIFFDGTLGLPFPMRVILTIVILAPIGFLMGIPFPSGFRWLTENLGKPDNEVTGEKNRVIPAIPWIWAANGASSVIASILAALLALSFGFTWVLRIGAFCYFGALLILMGRTARRLPLSPRR